MRTAALIAAIFVAGFAAQGADLDTALAKAAAFEYGESRDALYEIRDIINAAMGDAARLREIESRLAALLDSGATVAGKDFACRQLALIGTEASVPSLQRLLSRAETVDMALFALSRIPGRAADDALATALKSVPGKPQIAVINAIGARRDARAVPALREVGSEIRLGCPVGHVANEQTYSHRLSSSVEQPARRRPNRRNAHAAPNLLSHGIKSGQGKGLVAKGALNENPLQDSTKSGGNPMPGGCRPTGRPPWSMMEAWLRHGRPVRRTDA